MTVLEPQGRSREEQALKVPAARQLHDGAGQGSQRRRIARGIASGATAAALSYGAISVGLLAGAPAVLLLVVITASLPVSPQLSPRLAIGGVLFLGWTPLTWFFTWPWQVNHGGIVLSAAIGALVGWLLAGRGFRERSRALLPRVEAADVLPLAAGLMSAMAMMRWITVDTPKRALIVLLPGYDNVGHFSMFQMLRKYGVTSDRLGPAPDGTSWHYSHYPQGFHTVAATYADLAGLSPLDNEQQLVAYAESVGAVVVFTMVVLVAALCSLPPIRDNWLLALPSASLILSAFLLGPGGTAIADGFAPFWFAVALTSVVLILAVGLSRRLLPIHVAAICGALVCIAHSWAPLCLVAMSGLVAYCLSVGRPWRRPLSTRGIISLVIVSAMIFGVGKAALLLLQSVTIENVVSAVGGFSPPEPVRLFATIGITTLLSLLVFTRLTEVAGSAHRRTVVRSRGLLSVVVFGIASAVWLLQAQLRSNGEPTYYWFKYVAGLELVFVVIVAITACIVLGSFPNRWGRGHAAALCVIATLFGTLAFCSGPQAFDLLKEERVGTADIRADKSLAQLADNILGAAGAVEGLQVPTALVALPPGNTTQASFPQQWLLATTGRLSSGAMLRLGTLLTNVDSVDRAAQVLEPMLSLDHQLVVFVPPGYVQALRTRLDRPTFSRRVQTWTGEDFSDQTTKTLTLPAHR